MRVWIDVRGKRDRLYLSSEDAEVSLSAHACVASAGGGACTVSVTAALSSQAFFCL